MQQFGWVRRQTQLLVVLAWVASSIVVLRATSHGVGLSPDSLQYLAASESAASGHRMTTVAWDGTPAAFTHYPPGYPLLLAAGARLGWQPQAFARYANIVLYAITMILVTLIARRLVPDPPWAAPVAAISCAVAHDLIVIHSMAWSEPPYLTLTLAGIFALATALERHSAKWLALAGAAGGVAAVVRYVGVANVGFVSLAVLFWWPTSFWKRVRAAALVSVLAALPSFAVVVSARMRSETVANREVLWHPIGMQDVRIAASVVAKWITPLSDATYVSVVWLALLGVLAAILVTSRARQAVTSDLSPTGRKLALILLLFAATYIGVLVLAMSFVDAQTTFEPRMLVPVLTVAIILGVGWLARQTRSGGVVRLAAIAIIGLFVGVNVMHFYPWQREAHRHGLALRRLERKAQALVLATRQLPAETRIYSNDPYYLRVQAPRPVAGLPRQLDPNSLLPNTHHSEQVRAICESALQRPTVLVLFDAPVSGDSTARAVEATRSGEVAKMFGGVMIRVRPGCAQ